jgi:hypothetical protein
VFDADVKWIVYALKGTPFELSDVNRFEYLFSKIDVREQFNLRFDISKTAKTDVPKSHYNYVLYPSSTKTV